MMTGKGTLIVACLLLLLTASVTTAQEAVRRLDQIPRFQEQTFATLHEVRVTDAYGRVIRGLAQNDFEVLVEEQPRSIEYFEERSDYPVTLACLVDTGSNMSAESVGRAKSLILELIHRLDSRDEILLASYLDQVYFLTDFTSDRLALLEGLRNISAVGRKGAWARLGRLFASSSWTGLAIDETLMRMKNGASNSDRFILVMSAGFGNIGVGTLDHLQLAGVRFLAVSVDNRMGDVFNLGGDQAARRRIVEQTGGISYSANAVLERMDQMRDFIKHHYLLAYHYTDADFSKERPRFKVRIPAHPEYKLYPVRRSRGQSAVY